MRKIDIHCHAHAFPQYTPRGPRGDIFLTGPQLLEINDSLDIEYGVLLTLVPPEARSQMIFNEDCQYLVDQHPDRFLWFCGVDPRQGNYNDKTDLGHLLRFYKERGALGVGELTTTLDADDPMMDNLFVHCAKLNMPILIHIAPQHGDTYGIVDQLGLPRIEKMLKKHPGMIMIGHSAAFWGETSNDLTEEMRNDYPTGKVTEGRLPYLMRECSNLYCDLSAGSGSNAMMRDPEYAGKFLTEFQDRILYGNDVCHYGDETPYIFDKFLLQLVADGKITQEIYEKIIRKNAVKLLGLPE